MSTSTPSNTDLMAAIAGLTAAVSALVSLQQPAVVAPVPAAKAAPKPKAAVKVRYLCKANRVEFVKAHAWAQGLSTRQIAAELVMGSHGLNGNWALGDGYRALVTGRSV